MAFGIFKEWQSTGINHKVSDWSTQNKCSIFYTLHRQRAFNFVGPDAVLGRCFFGCCDVRARRNGDGPGTSGDD